MRARRECRLARFKVVPTMIPSIFRPSLSLLAHHMHIEKRGNQNFCAPPNRTFACPLRVDPLALPGSFVPARCGFALWASSHTTRMRPCSGSRNRRDRGQATGRRNVRLHRSGSDLHGPPSARQPTSVVGRTHAHGTVYQALAPDVKHVHSQRTLGVYGPGGRQAADGLFFSTAAPCHPFWLILISPLPPP